MMEKQTKTEKKETKTADAGLTILIRISGMVKVNEKIENALYRLKLRRKYSAVVVDASDKQIKGMIDKVKHYIAYGPIDEKVLVKLIGDRAKNIEGDKRELKIDAEKVAKDLIAGKKLSELGLKPFFRLHPPRKGIKSKLQYPKGVLGNNKKDINKLVEKML